MQTRKISIVLVEDHALVRAGLKNLLSLSSEYNVVGEAEDGLAAIRCILKHTPSLALIDLRLPKKSGLEVIAEIKKRSPEVKMLALTAHKSEDLVHAALAAGASGYVSKNATYRELDIAIKSILEGKTYLCPAVSGKVVERYLQSRKTTVRVTKWDTLTKREREVLNLIAEGNKNKEIAVVLYISVKTVEKHRANLIKKLDLHNSAALTAYAIKNLRLFGNGEIGGEV